MLQFRASLPLTLGKSPNLSVPQLLPLLNGNNNCIFFIGMIWELNELVYVKILEIVPGTLKTCPHIVFATVILCMGNLDLCFSGFWSYSQYGFIHSASSVYLTWYCEYGAKWREKGVHIAPVRPVLLLVMCVCVGGAIIKGRKGRHAEAIYWNWKQLSQHPHDSRMRFCLGSFPKFCTVSWNVFIF